MTGADASLTTVHELFVAQARRRPDAIALSLGDAHLTYGELDLRSTRLAHRLRALGVGRETLVGICLPRSFDMIVALLGTLKAGGAYLPLDSSYPADRLEFMLDDARARVLVTSSEIAPTLEAHDAHVLRLDVEELAHEPTTALPDPARPDDLAYVIYTSGSTGRPKGSLIPHRNVSRLFTSTDTWFHFDEHDVWTLFHSFAFDFSVWEIWGALCYGGRLVIVPYVTSRSPDQFHVLLQRERVTVLNQTPSAFLQLVAVDAGAPPDSLALRYVIFGGEALDPRRIEPWFARHGDGKPQLVNMYGITETTVHVTYRPLTRANVDARSVIGVPISDLTVHALDPQLARVAPGAEGELYVGGAGLARGYLGRPELTAQRFIADPFSSAPGARLYRTGDLGRILPDGSIEYLGRIDHQVKIRGFRVELGEIEAVLLAHPSVESVTVSLREDTPGDPRLVAYVVPRQRGATLELGPLREATKQKLPAHMVPSAFVVLDALPLTANGKLDRKALPAPSQTRPDLPNERVAPRDDLELRLVELWESLFGVAPLGVTDDFFALGGSSLRAVQMLAQIEQSTGRRLSAAELFVGATIEHLAKAIRADASVVFRELVAIQRGKTRPLFLVHPVGGNALCYIDLAHKLGPDESVYAFQSRGLDGRDAPASDLVEMATRYLAAARELQPHGPYRLGGYSSGGVVAYEMAQQLRRAGEEVELLLLLDSRAPNVKFQTEGVTKTRNFDDVVMSYWMLIILGRTLGKELPIEQSAFEERTADERVALLLAQLQEHGLMPPGVGAAQMRAALDVYKANLRALMLYEPKPYAGPVVLVKVAERLPDRKNTPNPPPWNWDEFVQGGIEEHVVPGNHFVMMGKDVVDHVVRSVRACLDRLEASGRQ